jgi:phosphotransferase system HPr (HPr) family protein
VCRSDNRVTAEVRVVNQQGLHARPVMKFVDLVSGHKAQVTVDRGEGTEPVDGASPMHMMLLAAPKGTTLRITACGEDADAVIEALVELVRGGFGEP